MLLLLLLYDGRHFRLTYYLYHYFYAFDFDVFDENPGRRMESLLSLELVFMIIIQTNFSTNFILNHMATLN